MPSAISARSRSRSARSVARGSAKSGSVMGRDRTGPYTPREYPRSVVHMTIEKDPVCGMDVDTSTTDLKLEHDGQTYWFCGRGCYLEFRDDPERFLDPDYEPSM